MSRPLDVIVARSMLYPIASCPGLSVVVERSVLLIQLDSRTYQVESREPNNLSLSTELN